MIREPPGTPAARCIWIKAPWSKPPTQWHEVSTFDLGVTLSTQGTHDLDAAVDRGRLSAVRAAGFGPKYLCARRTKRPRRRSAVHHFESQWRGLAAQPARAHSGRARSCQNYLWQRIR